jgi:pimeloyl-ACP methyl ester carboxylesterase
MKSPEAYAPQNIEPFWFEDSERHDTAMREAVETLVLTTDDGQRFSALHLNRDFSEKPPIVSLNAMFTGCNSPEQKYKAYQYAAANPERPIVALDMPAHGYSDRLTDVQYWEIIGRSGLTAIGCSLAEVLRGRLEDAQEMVVVGDSLGARIGFDFTDQASDFGFETSNIFGFDPVGLEDRSTLAVNVSYFAKEALRSRRLYTSEPNDRLNYGYETVFKRELAKRGFENNFSMMGVFRTDPRILRFLVAGSPLAPGTGITSIKRMLLRQQSLTANMVVGGLSSICRQREVVPALEQVEDELFGDRLQHEVWPNDAHGMGLAPQQPRMAAFVRDMLLESRTANH